MAVLAYLVPHQPLHLVMQVLYHLTHSVGRCERPAERLISELSETEFQPEKYEDEYRQRLLKAIEQKITGQEIQRVEVEARPPTTDLVATLEARLGRKELAKVSPRKSKWEPVSEKRPVRRKRAS